MEDTSATTTKISPTVTTHTRTKTLLNTTPPSNPKNTQAMNPKTPPRDKTTTTPSTKPLQLQSNARPKFLYNGLTKFGENGVYVVLEETPQQLRENLFNSFNWNIGSYEDSGNLVILDAISSRLGLSSQERFVVPRPFTLEALLYEIQTAIQTAGARRVVIDSLDAMS